MRPALFVAFLAAFALAKAAEMRHRVRVVAREEPELPPDVVEQVEDFLAKQPVSDEVEAKVERATGGYWNYGLCVRKHPVVGMGAARWPLHHGALKVQGELTTETGESVTFFDDRYVVLNSKYLSIFSDMDHAKNCSKPEAVTDVADILSVDPFNSEFLPSKMAADEMGGLCFLVQLVGGKSLVMCSESRHMKHEWVHTLRFKLRLKDTFRLNTREFNPEINSRTADEMENSNVPRIPPTFMFPAAPNTISLRQRMGACLTGGVRAQAAPAQWGSDMPIAAIAEQQWEVKAAPKDETLVTICQRASVGVGRCLTLDHLSNVTLEERDEPKEFTACPGEDMTCFVIEEQTTLTPPSRLVPDPCREKCEAMEPDCGGWEYRRPGTDNKKHAHCCLKKAEATGASCHSSPCCVSQMFALTHQEWRVVKSAFVNGGPDHGAVRMVPLRPGTHEDYLDQYWRVVPLGDRVAHIQFHEGDKCLTSSAQGVPPMDGAPVWLQDCSEDNPDQRWTFNGFEEPRDTVYETVSVPYTVTHQTPPEPREPSPSVPGAGDAQVLKAFVDAVKNSDPETKRELGLE